MNRRRGTAVRGDPGYANTQPSTDIFGQTQPAATESERSLLAAILTDQEAIHEAINLLEPEDFYTAKYALIYKAMQALWNQRQPIDITTVRETVEDPAIDGVVLSDLMASTFTVANAETYAKRIKGASERRALIRAAGEISSVGFQESDADVAAERATQILLSALDTSENEDKVLAPAQQAHLMVEMYEGMAQGLEPALATGFDSLDAATFGGFRPGELIIVAGRTSAGKSSYAENIAEYVAKHDKAVMYFNIEMSPRKMLQRYVRRSARLSTSALQFGPTHEKDLAELYLLAEERMKMPLYLVNDAAATTASVHAKIARYTMRNGPLSLVVIDYLQLMKDKETKSGSEPLRIANITRNLHNLAREFDVPIILISQLNRNVEYRGGEPELHDLAHSGSIENDADIVLLLWNDDDDDDHHDAKKRLKIAKQRDGPQIELPIHFDGSTFRFTDGNAPQSQ